MKTDKVSSPQVAKKLLHLALRKRDFSNVAGDFEEIFRVMVKDRGLRRARLWYWGHVWVSLPALLKNNLLWSLAMFKNYLKVTLRSIRRHSVYSLVNISGLAIGMACCFLLLLWVHDELSFDRFHSKAGSLFRVVNRSDNMDYLVTPGGLGPALEAELPEIVNTMRSAPNQRRLLQYGDTQFYEDGVFLADPSFFAMFDFPLLQGDARTALAAPDSVVLTESLALKLFGEDDPLGKTLTVSTREECRVMGVMADIPHNSHVRFTMVRSFEVIPDRFKQWDGGQWNTYVQLREGASPADVGVKITALVHRHQGGGGSRYYLQPLTSTRLFSSSFQYDSARRGDIKYVYIFSALAVFVLLIACINFMNLSTARSGNRALEVGMRKVVGARRSDLIRQFFGESLILSFLALLLAAGIVFLSLPVFNALSGKSISLSVTGDVWIWTMLVATTLITGLVSGSYPALVLSSFRPAGVLKGKLRAGFRGRPFRKALVVFQFSLTIFLVIGTLGIYRQLRFMQDANLGFDQEHILYLQMHGGLNEKYEAVKAELLRSPAIADITSSYVPVSIGSGAYGIWDGKRPEDEVHMYVASVDTNFLDFFGMELADGRFFSHEFPTDRTEAFVVNEAAVRAMGMKVPVGQNFAIGGGQVAGRIIGVVRDFHFRPLHTSIEPFILIYRPEEFWQLAVKVSPGKTYGALEFLESTWRRFVPGFPPDYQFLDDTLKTRYQAERQIGALFRYFTGLAVFIACLGLFGLSSYMAERRTKEIGIRKVLGASSQGITFLLTREFTRWILAANLIAWPLAYLAMHRWLEGFAYRSGIGLWMFPAAAGLSLIVALLTVGVQALRAARTDPVDSLRYE